jgi:hypothetical protein
MNHAKGPVMLEDVLYIDLVIICKLFCGLEPRGYYVFVEPYRRLN